MSGENNPMFGRTHCQGVKARISEALKERILSAETLAKMSEAKKGDKHPRGMKGKTHTEETLAKISEVMTGESHSDETLAKISEALRGRSSSAETIYVYDSEGN